MLNKELGNLDKRQLKHHPLMNANNFIQGGQKYDKY